MNREIAVTALFFVLFICGNAAAEPCKSQITGELWAENSYKIMGVDLTSSICPTWFTGLRAGISYYADERYLYEGLTGSARFQYGDRLTPFIGIGILAGIAEKEVDASGDGIDNNQNGFIDEYGEKKKLYETNAFLYPEVGVTLYTKKLGYTISARQYYGSKFVGNVIISFGLVIQID